MPALRLNRWRGKFRMAGQILACAVGLALVWASSSAAQERLTLEQAVRLALERNPALQAAAEESTVARARVGQARAGWLPRLDFSQGFTRGNNPVYVFGTLLTQRQFSADNFALFRLNAPKPLDNFQTRFDGQIMLFDSLRTPLRVRSARRAATAADHQIEQERQDLILRVVGSYYAAVVAREALAAANEAVRSAESNAARARSLETAGLMVGSDRMSAEVFLAQMKEREIRAGNAVHISRMVLARELGGDAASLPETLEPLPQPRNDNTTLDEWERLALAERPALKAAELQREVAGTHQQLAKAEFGPRLGLFANFERDAETLSGPSGTNWTAGARLEFNFFAGGADRQRLVEAQARSRQADRQVEWFRSGVLLEVRKAYLEVQAADARVAATRDAVAQSAESLRIVQNRYEAGLTTLTELLRAQTARLETRTAYLAALHDAHEARAQLARAAGSLKSDSALIRRPEGP